MRLCKISSWRMIWNTLHRISSRRINWVYKVWADMKHAEISSLVVKHETCLNHYSSSFKQIHSTITLWDPSWPKIQLDWWSKLIAFPNWWSKLNHNPWKFIEIHVDWWFKLIDIFIWSTIQIDWQSKSNENQSPLMIRMIQVNWWSTSINNSSWLMIQVE